MVALPRCFRKIQGASTAMAKARNSMDDKPKRAACWISLIYALVGAIWILASDQVVERLFPDSHSISHFQTYKGLGYITVTAVSLYLALRILFRRTESDVVKLSLEIARRVLRRELTIDPSVLESLVKVALEKLQSQEISRVRVHPDHQAIMHSSLVRCGAGQQIEVVGDPGQPHGGAIFEINNGKLDASIDTQLQEIEQGLADRFQRS